MALDSMSCSVKQTNQETKPHKEPETTPAVFVGSLAGAGPVWFDPFV